MGKFVDISNERYGKLTTIKRVGTSKTGSALWECACDCGGSKEYSSFSLRQGDAKSCGCLLESHGEARTRLYRIYQKMKDRCLNTKHKQYFDYGGRGIQICEEWLSSYIKFRDWALTAGYKEKTHLEMSIDRIDNDKGYSPSNCQWADRSFQTYKQRMHSNNTSGKTGVTWVKRNSTWMSRIRKQGEEVFLGYFPRLEDAIEARLKAEIKYFGFHRDTQSEYLYVGED